MARGFLVMNAEGNGTLYYRPRPFGQTGLAWVTDVDQALHLAHHVDAEIIAASLPIRTRIIEEPGGC